MTKMKENSSGQKVEVSRYKMIEQIEEFFSNKNLRVGCRLQRNGDNAIIVGMSGGYGYDVYSENRLYECQSICGYDDYSDDGIDDGIYKIIGHKVMIGDVLDKIQKREKCGCLNNIIICGDKKYKVTYCKDCDINNIVYTIYKLREFKRKPIGDQSDDCIKYVYSLIYIEK